MKQYKIDGTERVTPIQCRSCYGGATKEIKDTNGTVIHIVKMFDNLIRHHKFSSSIAEHICGACNTKYKAVRIDADRLMDSDCQSCPHNGKYCKLEDKEIICAGNIDKFITSMEVTTMNEDLIKAKNEFNISGICKKHEWVEGSFKTFEGRFTVKNCKICGTAISDYKGENIMGDLRAVTNFIISKGIAKEKITISRMNVSDTIFSSVPLFDLGNEIDSMFTVQSEALADKVKPVITEIKLF